MLNSGYGVQKCWNFAIAKFHFLRGREATEMFEEMENHPALRAPLLGKEGSLWGDGMSILSIGSILSIRSKKTNYKLQTTN